MPSFERWTLAVLFALGAAIASSGVAFAQSGLKHPRDAVEVFVKATAAADADAIAALYAPKAIFLAPNTPAIAGRAEIRSIFARNFKLGANTIQFTDIKLDGAGDRAVVIWEWTSEIVPAAGAPHRMHGRSMVYFIRSAEGWLISADMMQPAPKR